MTFSRAIHRFGVLITANEFEAGLPETVRAAFSDYRLIILRGLGISKAEEFANLCREVFQRDFLNWESGDVMEMKPCASPKNYLFSTERVPFHWDGAFHKTPSILAFHCLQAPRAQSGGETLFTNTELILGETDKKEKSNWGKINLTYKTEKLAHYGGEFSTTLIARHPERNTEVLRFAEEVKTELNPVSLTVSGLDSTQTKPFLSSMRRRLYDPSYCYTHEWRKGDIIFADNHSLLHARHAFLKETNRHLRRIQII